MQRFLRTFWGWFAVTALFLGLASCRQTTDPAPAVANQPAPGVTPINTSPSGESPPATAPRSATDQPAAPSPTPLPVYPGPDGATPAPYPYPYPGPPTPLTGDGDPAPAFPASPDDNQLHFPVVGGPAPTATPTSTATPTPSVTPAATATPTAVPTVDFAARRAALAANDQGLSTVKIGFHVTLMEDRDLLDNWMRRLDAAGVPVFLKSVDNAEPLFRAQELMRRSGVPHVLVYRASGSVPDYALPPAQAARLHWEFHRANFPPELDPNLVWIETLNEPDRKRSQWLGQFALETARLAMADGFRWAAFGWASGEPEPAQWRSPAMLEFLRLAGENPERLAIAVHEYSYIKSEIDHDYPYKIGRFLALFDIADQHGFPRPTVLITEWGWEYAAIPDVGQAIADVDWATRLYAPFPQVKGAAIWNLGIGCCFADISEQVTRLVGPLTLYSLTHYFAIPPDGAPVSTNPEQFR
jgi:hypothetical protein